MPQASILEVQDLHTYIGTPEGIARILNGISISLREGETLGLVGESGSGKSILARSILNLIEPPGRIVRGKVLFEGRDLLTTHERALTQIRGSKISLIVPNPHTHLNPLISVGEQVANVITAHRKVPKGKALEEAVRLLDRVGIPDAVNRSRALPHELSGGMAQRVIIIMALVNSPRVLIADEPSGGLDVTVQLQILDLMRDLVRNQGSSVILITRDLGIVAHYCDRVAVMYAGQIIEEAPVNRFFAAARHPYSLELLRLGSPAYREITRYGRGDPVLNPVRRPSGCPFHPRCLLAEAVCKSEWPETDALSEDHLIHCHFARSIKVAAAS